MNGRGEPDRGVTVWGLRDVHGRGMVMSYLINTWYCVGWSESVPAEVVVPIKVIDREFVLFRDLAGQAAALENRCPHRFAPLDRGRICHGRLQCGYHGLLFDGEGHCVENPHGKGVITSALNVRSFPLIERYGALWLWPGDAAPDEALLPNFSAFDPETAYVGRRHLHAKANYELAVDNILDLSHIQYLHGSTLGSAAISRARTSVERVGNSIWSRRLVIDEQLTPFLEKAFFIQPGQHVDRRLDVRWDAPASLLLEVTVRPTGRPESEAHLRTFAHLFTPETVTTTHYYFALSYPKTMGEQFQRLAIDGIAAISVPFETEDLPMLEAQQRVVGSANFMKMRPAMLPGDAGATLARRALAKLIAREQAAEPADSDHRIQTEEVA